MTAASIDHRWVPRHDVLWAEHGEVTTILSFGTGQYATLDEVGGRIWRHLCAGHSPGEIAHLIHDEYQAPDPSEVTADVAELLQLLRDRKLVRTATAAPRSSPQVAVKPMPGRLPRVPSLMVCLLTLAISHTAIRLFGFRRLMRSLPRFDPKTAIPPGAEQWLAALERRIQVASVIYPLDAACLERSFQFLWLSRSAGLATQLRIGLQPYPFAAHAWAEFAGRPFLDSGEYLTKYRALPAVDDAVFDHV